LLSPTPKRLEQTLFGPRQSAQFKETYKKSQEKKIIIEPGETALIYFDLQNTAAMLNSNTTFSLP